jgi:hypothetical protein
MHVSHTVSVGTGQAAEKKHVQCSPVKLAQQWAQTGERCEKIVAILSQPTTGASLTLQDEL